jgi:hypothetical protein
MKTVRTVILVLFAIVTSIIGSQCIWIIPDEIQATNAWMLCDAISKFLFVGAFWCEAKNTLKHVLFAAMILCLNNLLDELFFDPLRLGWNEIVMLVLITIYTTIVYAKFNR